MRSITGLAEIHDTTREPLRSQLSAEHVATKKVIAEKTAKLRKELDREGEKRGRVNLDIANGRTQVPRRNPRGPGEGGRQGPR